MRIYIVVGWSKEFTEVNSGITDIDYVLLGNVIYYYLP